MVINQYVRDQIEDRLLAILLCIHFGVNHDATKEELLKLCELKLIEKVSYADIVEFKTIGLFSELADIEFVNDFRKLWSKSNTGIPGKMSSKETIKVLLDRWMANNPSYTKEEILKAAKYYIDNYGRISNGIIQSCDNFIYKLSDGVPYSKLSSVIDEVEEDDEWN